MRKKSIVNHLAICMSYFLVSAWAMRLGVRSDAMGELQSGGCLITKLWLKVL